MNTRITLDLKKPALLTLLRLEAAQENKTIRELVVEALESHYGHKLENHALMKLAAKSFAEWDNQKDADYDKL